MPRYELSEGTSNKFWEIALSGASFTTTYGRIGTAGQTTRKEFASAAEAKRAHDTLIAEKLAKGYVLAGSAPPPPVPVEPRNAKLEAPILADPYNVAAYRAYEAWLTREGALRGELMKLQLADEAKPGAKPGKPSKAAARLIADHAGYFLGPLAEHQKTRDGRDGDAFTWRFGFIHAARLSHNQYEDEAFQGSLAEVLRALLDHPSGRFVAELAFGFNKDPNDGTLDDLIGVLAKRAPATLRKLHLGDFVYPDETEMSWYHVGHLGKLWKAVPRLASLIVQGGDFQLGTIDLPALTHAEFRTGGLSPASARAIARARWPRIERLEVWYGHPDYGATAKVADAMALLDRTDLKKLTSLGIKNTAFTDELCGEIGRGKLLGKLARLDLSMGTMTDEGARRLAAQQAALRHLAVLDVSANYLTRAGIATLKGVAKSVISAKQREIDDPEYRHPSVGE